MARRGLWKGNLRAQLRVNALPVTMSSRASAPAGLPPLIPAGGRLAGRSLASEGRPGLSSVAIAAPDACHLTSRHTRSYACTRSHAYSKVGVVVAAACMHACRLQMQREREREREREATTARNCSMYIPRLRAALMATSTSRRADRALTGAHVQAGSICASSTHGRDDDGDGVVGTTTATATAGGVCSEYKPNICNSQFRL
jgi:hypothetical protein